MTMAYVTFTGVNSGPCYKFHPTQALANATATDNANVAAHVGILDVGDLQIRHAYFDGTAVVSDEAYRLALLAALPEVDKLKNAFRNFHDGLILGSQFLETPTIKLYYPDGDRQIAHDMLALTHRAARGIGLSSHWTSLQKFTWLATMALGPTDVSFANGAEAAAARFFEVVEEAREGGTPLVAPTQYFMWVHPDTAMRWQLSECNNNLVDPSDDFAAATTDFTIFKNGGWIDGITI